MADQEGDAEPSEMEKIPEKFHSRDASSSSDSDDDNPSAINAMKSKVYKLFGRERPVHKVLGGGKRTLSPLPLPPPL